MVVLMTITYPSHIAQSDFISPKKCIREKQNQNRNWRNYRNAQGGLNYIKGENNLEVIWFVQKLVKFLSFFLRKCSDPILPSMHERRDERGVQVMNRIESCYVCTIEISSSDPTLSKWPKRCSRFREPMRTWQEIPAILPFHDMEHCARSVEFSWIRELPFWDKRVSHANETQQTRQTAMQEKKCEAYTSTSSKKRQQLSCSQQSILTRR